MLTWKRHQHTPICGFSKHWTNHQNFFCSQISPKTPGSLNMWMCFFFNKRLQRKNMLENMWKNSSQEQFCVLRPCWTSAPTVPARWRWTQRWSDRPECAAGPEMSCGSSNRNTMTNSSYRKIKKVPPVVLFCNLGNLTVGVWEGKCCLMNTYTTTLQHPLEAAAFITATIWKCWLKQITYCLSWWWSSR